MGLDALDWPIRQESGQRGFANFALYPGSLQQVTPIGVALREGGVDRNSQAGQSKGDDIVVALREGGVDRNLAPFLNQALQRVALREGGVDRNTTS